MKNLIKNTIISQAIELGFDFENQNLEELKETLIDFFNDNSDRLPQLEDECEVTSYGNRQHVRYGDFWSAGEIVDFSNHWHKSPDTKIFHSDFVMEDKDGLMKNMNLYYLVGETDYNAPEGYYFDKSEKKHIKH